MSNQGYGHNPYWFPEHTGRKPDFNMMGVMTLAPEDICPINGGMVAWWSMNEGAGGIAHDIVCHNDIDKRSSVWTRNGIVNADSGMYVPGNLGSSFPGITYIFKISAFAYAAWYEYLFDGRTGTGTYCYTINSDSGSVVYGGTILQASLNQYVGSPLHLVIVDNGANAYGYSNGVYNSNQTTSVSRSIGSGLRIGSRYSDNESRAGRTFEYFSVYKRALNAKEVAQLYTHPYGTPSQPRFLYAVPRAWFVPSGAVTAYSLACNFGSIAESGQAVSLLAARKIIADYGAFTEAGQDAALRASRKVIADYGALTESGQDAGLIARRKVSADYGLYAETGQDAGLYAGRKVTADFGSFGETGQDAGLKATRKISADYGNFTESGQTITALAARMIAAAYGSYVLTGQDADLTLATAGAYVISAGYGAFVLTGEDASLLAARKLAADYAGYTESGIAAALLHGYKLIAGEGAYTEAGQAASLLAARILTGLNGSFIVMGQDATLRYVGSGSYLISADAGAFAISGQDVLWKYYSPNLGSRTCLVVNLTGADARAFALTGADARAVKLYIN